MPTMLELRLGFRPLLPLIVIVTAGCGSPDETQGTTPASSTSAPAASTTAAPTTGAVPPPAATTAPVGTPAVSTSTPAPAPPPPPATVVSYATDVEPLFVAKCVTSCHSPKGFGGPEGTSTESTVDLSQGVGYAQLTTGASVVNAEPFIGDTLEGSYLWLKLTNAQTAGLSMPFGSKLGAEDLAKVQAWLEGGAQP